MRVRVKVCGITSLDSALAALAAGADAVGFVFADSPRRIAPEEAARISARLPANLERVAVFRHPDPAEVERVFERFLPDVLQSEMDDGSLLSFHRAARLLPVFHDSGDLLTKIEAFLERFPEGPTRVHLEGRGRGGRGVSVDRVRAAAVARRVAVVLAGGLDAENVGAAISAVRPYGVDVSSGVEAEPGVKDAGKIRRFVGAVRAAEEDLRASSTGGNGRGSR